MATYKDRGIEAEFDQAEFQHLISEGYDSDFLLEAAVVRCLRKFAFDVEHSGYYTDPATGKARQFDVRATKINPHTDVHFYLSLECKNIGKNFPLLVSTTPRDSREISYLRGFGFAYPYGIQPHQTNCPLYGSSHVGRAVCQYERRRDNRNGYKYNNRNDRVGEKWTQTLSQLQEFATANKEDIYNSQLPTFFIPILVVNNDTLWEVGYTDDMEVEYPPHQVQNTDLIISHGFLVSYGVSNERFNVSHLHISTINGLPDLLTKIIDTRP